MIISKIIANDYFYLKIECRDQGTSNNVLLSYCKSYRYLIKFGEIVDCCIVLQNVISRLRQYLDMKKQKEFDIILVFCSRSFSIKKIMQYQKSLFITYLLWLIGGWIGLHHFYLRRDKQAFLWWSTFGGVCLLGKFGKSSYC